MDASILNYNSLRQPPKLVKQAAHGLTAHLYEHAVANVACDYLFNSDCLLLTDYDMWPATMSRTCLVDVRLQSKGAGNAYAEAIDYASTNMTPQDYYRAAEECTCEYKRKHRLVEQDFLRELGALSAEPWKSDYEYRIDIAAEAASVDTAFTTPGISYGPRVPQSFKEIIFEYVVPKKFFVTNPELRPLAMVLVQAIALNQIFLISKAFRCYDAGDDWEKGGSRLAYRHWLRFKKINQPSFEELDAHLISNWQSLKDKRFISKIHWLLHNNYAKEELRYFSDRTTYNLTGTVVGAKGWREIATEENIRFVLENLHVKVFDGDGERRMQSLYKAS